MAGRRGRRTRGTHSRGQSETIGVVLVLALTLIGATIALTFGATALNDARIDSQEGGIEHAMTQLDSRSAMVGLGDSATQRVPLASTGAGTYYIDQDSGWINVTHHEYDGSNTEVIYNESLGALVYESEDTKIAYQGGGVWVAEGGTSRMVSPPEFHYRGATLTLPVIRLQGTASESGRGVTAEITQVTRAERIFPNLGTTYGVGTNTYVNPIREGNVTVTVKSEYYEAWAAFFRARTTGNVTVDHSGSRVTVQLIAQGVGGDFEMPADGNSIEIRGLGDGHPIEDFNITLIDDDGDAADFSNLKWSLHAEKGSKRFEIHLRDTGGGGCGDSVGATIYYSDNNGADYESWTNSTAFHVECETDDNRFNDDDDFDDKRLVANFTSATNMTYDKVKGGDGVLLFHSVSGSDEFVDPTTFDEHEDTIAWEGSSAEFYLNNETTIDNVTNHYISLMGPTVKLTVADAAGNTVNEEASTGQFEQAGGSGKFITFLHITENEVEIRLE